MREKLLTKDEVARVTGWSHRWIEKRLKSVPGPKGRNGRPQPMYPLSTIPAEARQKWLATFGWGAVDGGNPTIMREVLVGEDEVRRLLGEEGTAPSRAAQTTHRALVAALTDRSVAALTDRAVAALPDPEQLALELPAPVTSSLSPADRAVADHRYQIIEPLIAPERHQALWRQFAGKGALVAFLAQQHKTPARTIYNWMQRWNGSGSDVAAGMTGLVHRDRSDKGRSRILIPEVQRYIAVRLLPEKPSPGRTGHGEMRVREIYREYQEDRAWRAGRPDPGPPLPQATYETFRVWAAKMPAIIRDVAARGDDAFWHDHAFVTWRDPDSCDPLDLVVLDHRMADWFCLVRDPRKLWRLVRPWLTAAIDYKTRKWLAWALVETPSSDSIAAVLKRVILDHGLSYRQDGAGQIVCKTKFAWDRGKDFSCHYISGGHYQRSATYRIDELGPAFRGVCDSLGIRVTAAIAKRPHSKIIEPNFLRISNYDRKLPWWCGNKPEHRPAHFDELVREHQLWMAGKREHPAFIDGEGNLLDIEYAAWLYAEELKTLNDQPLHGEGMRKAVPQGWADISPNECWQQHIGGVDRRSADPAILQFAFHKRKPKPLMVSQGEVRITWGGRLYHYRIAGNDQALLLFNERKVDVAYDQHDLGTIVLYAENQFVGLANNVELQRVGEKDFVQNERDRRSALRSIKAFIAGVHQDPIAPPEERARRREEVRAALPPGKSAHADPACQAMPMPQAIEQAAAAAAADANFSFSGASSTALTSETPAPAAAVAQPPPAAGEISEDDGEFRFFGG